MHCLAMHRVHMLDSFFSITFVTNSNLVHLWTRWEVFVVQLVVLLLSRSWPNVI